MSRPKVYLAGPITGQTYAGATDWREGMRKALEPHIMGMSPMRGKDYLADMAGTIGGTPEESYMKAVISSQAGILGRDRNDVRTADVVLMNLLGAKIVSIGTMIEAGWADAYRIPIVLVTEGKENIHNHVMLYGLATYIVPDLDTAEHLIRVLLGVPGMKGRKLGLKSEAASEHPPTGVMVPQPGGGL